MNTDDRGAAVRQPALLIKVRRRATEALESSRRPLSATAGRQGARRWSAPVRPQATAAAAAASVLYPRPHGGGHASGRGPRGPRLSPMICNRHGRSPLRVRRRERLPLLQVLPPPHSLTNHPRPPPAGHCLVS